MCGIFYLSVNLFLGIGVKETYGKPVSPKVRLSTHIVR